METTDGSVSTLWRAVGMLTIVILVASVIPVPAATPQTDPTGSVDTTTLLHIAGYATLAAGGVIAIAREGWPGRHRSHRVEISAVAGVVAAVGLFGVGTELLQSFVPWRTFAIAEIGLNVASALGGGLLATMWFYRLVE